MKMLAKSFYRPTATSKLVSVHLNSHLRSHSLHSLAVLPAVSARHELMPILTYRNVTPEDGMQDGWAYLMCGHGPRGKWHYPEHFKCDVHCTQWAWDSLGSCPLDSKHMIPFVKKWMQLIRRRQGEYMLQGMTVQLCSVQVPTTSLADNVARQQCKVQSVYLHHWTLLQVHVWQSAIIGPASPAALERA